MTSAKFVAILVILAALCGVSFAQGSSAEYQPIVVGNCTTLNDCLNNPHYVAKCQNIGDLCCDGKLAGQAGSTSDIYAVAIEDGKCTCCSNARNQVCGIVKATAYTGNPPTLATVEMEQCTSK